MNKCTAPTLIEKEVVFTSLIDSLRHIPDHRSDQGKRFELAFLLGIILLGLLKGKTSIEACVSFALYRKTWFNRWFDLTHGIPNATTVGRALAVTIPQEVIKAVNQFMISLEGVVIEPGASLDGKTVRAISELEDGCKHFLSLFSHNTCRILDQEGVVKKENEITATPRMLERHSLYGTLITADALLTQKQVTRAIIEAGADYVLIVKDNHPDLQTILEPAFSDPLTKKTADIFYEFRKSRCIETVVTTTQDMDFQDLRIQGWSQVTLVGKLERKGKRHSKRSEQVIAETIYFISSRESLLPERAYQFIRNHWHIENKLHWQKDVTWREDRSRARTGNISSILCYLRSLALQCIRKRYASVTRALEEFTERPTAYLKLLTQLQIV